jgi:hypothetical protein
MVKELKESHEKDVEELESLDPDCRSATEPKKSHALKNAPKHTVVCMKGLTSPVWTLGMFQMVTAQLSNQSIPKKKLDSDPWSVMVSNITR